MSNMVIWLLNTNHTHKYICTFSSLILKYACVPVPMYVRIVSACLFACLSVYPSYSPLLVVFFFGPLAVIKMYQFQFFPFVDLSVGCSFSSLFLL